MSSKGYQVKEVASLSGVTVRTLHHYDRIGLQIDRWYYPCSRRMHAGLAEMYEADPRFAASFDRHCEGLSSFLAEAIPANAAKAT